MKEWQTRFRRWLETQHPWLADCGLEVLIPMSAVFTVGMLLSRWWQVVMFPFALPWGFVVLRSLLTKRRPAQTDSQATRRAVYLWLVAFAPLAPAMIPLNAGEMILEAEFGKVAALTSTIAVAALGWPWAYAGMQFLLRPIGNNGAPTLLSILIAGALTYLGLDLANDNWFRLYLVFFPVIAAWLIALRLLAKRNVTLGMPSGPAFIGMAILCLACVADMFLFFADGGPILRQTRLWDPDDAWLFVSRYAFALGVPLLGFGCVGVAEGVAGK